MRTLKTIPAIFAPVIVISYMFTVNVIKLDVKRGPAVASNKLETVFEPSITWYSNLK